MISLANVMISQPDDDACKPFFIFLHVFNVAYFFFPLRHQHEKKISLFSKQKYASTFVAHLASQVKR